MTDDFDFDDLPSDDENPFDEVASDDGRNTARSLEEFETEVDRNMAILVGRKKYSTKERRDAALWLGESGAPRAIPPLKMVYEKDRKNKSVQEAAAYALGQFKALDEAIIRAPGEPVIDALEEPENQRILQQLQAVATYGQSGRRLPVPTPLLVRIELVLAVVLMILGLFNVLLLAGGGGSRVEPDRIAAVVDAPPDVIVDNIEGLTADLRTDAETIRDLLNPLIGGGTIACEQTWQNPPNYSIPAGSYADYPIVVTLVEDYNTQVTTLAPARTTIVDACSAAGEAGPALDMAQRDTALSDANTVLTALTGLETGITSARDQIASVEAQQTGEAESLLQADAAATASAIEQATAEILTAEAPTPTAIPGLSSADLREHTGQLRVIITEATGLRGHNSLLEQYWVAVRDNNTYDNCRIPRPSIPEDYALPPEVVGLTPQLDAAIEQVNVGLSISRLNWSSFAQGCQDGSLANRAQAGLDATELARSAYDLAEGLISELQGS